MSDPANNFNIKNISDWMPVSAIPTAGSKQFDSLNSMFGTKGIYQVALKADILKIGAELLHEDIGYTGKSASLLNRTYQIRAPKGNHGVSKFINRAGYDRDTEVFIRYVYADEYTELEDFVHTNAKSKFGYTFKWREASGGNDGAISEIIHHIEKLTSDQILDLFSELKDIAKTKALQEFEEKIKEKWDQG
jgi:hypothetical protein